MKRNWIGTAVLVLAVLWAVLGLNLQAARLGEAPGALQRLAQDAWPPALDESFLWELAHAMQETLQIALLSTVAGALLALPLAILSTRTLAPGPLAAAARLLASAIRVLPSLLWAIFAVLVVGLGPLAGILAMTLYTVGYLSKQQYEALEGVPRDALEAVRAMGANRFQQSWHVALPEAGNALRSQLLFMFEYNVRASSIIGLVGAGGIGQLISIHLRFFNYGHVLTIVLLLFATVAVLDVVSHRVRRRFVEAPQSRRPRWQEAVAGLE